MIFDEKQILRTEQYWEAQLLGELVDQAKADDSYIELKNQLRINADEKRLTGYAILSIRVKLRRFPVTARGMRSRSMIRPTNCRER